MINIGDQVPINILVLLQEVSRNERKTKAVNVQTEIEASKE